MNVIKYKARAIVTDEGRFDSMKEWRRFQDLKVLQKAGIISDLGRQKRYRIEVQGHHICDYVADFTYTENGVDTVEDVKSVITKKLPVYRLKKKLMAAVYGIEIKEV